MTEEVALTVRRLETEIALLKSRLERQFRYGKILEDTDIDVSDATKPRARIQIGLDAKGQPVKGPWLPYATMAGARNQHNPPSKDQQFIQIAPDGNHPAALLIPLGHWNNVKAPSTDPHTYVDQIGKTVNTQSDGSWTQAVDKATIVMSGSTITITADTIVLAGTVKLGGSDASNPAAMQGTVDTGGYADVSNLATKVLVK